MKTLKIFFLLFLITGFVGCIDEDKEKEQEGSNLQIGDELPDFIVEMNDGSELNSADLQGKVSVIVLFSVTCGHCQTQFEITEDVYKKYKDNPDVSMFGVSREQGKTQVGQYWRKNGMQMPYSAQDDRYIYSLFARVTVPRIYVSDTNRKIRLITTDNPLASAEQLIGKVDELLNAY